MATASSVLAQQGRRPSAPATIPDTVYAKAAYTLREVAALTGLPYRPIVDECRAGMHAHVHKGGRRTMTPDQIKALLAKYTEEPASEALDRRSAARARAAKRVAREAGKAA